MSEPLDDLNDWRRLNFVTGSEQAECQFGDAKRIEYLLVVR
jgi:hypothetical protein